MKKHLLLFVLLSASLFIKAQDSTKVKELGLTTRNLDSFGITYRFGTKTALWRLGIPSINVSNTETTEDSIINTRSDIGIAFSIGREWRKPITEKVELRLGSTLGCSYSKLIEEQSTLSKATTTTYIPNISLILGMNYYISDTFIIGAEITPGISYLISKRETSYTDPLRTEKREVETKNLNYTLRGYNALISLIYQF